MTRWPAGLIPTTSPEEAVATNTLGGVAEAVRRTEAAEDVSAPAAGSFRADTADGDSAPTSCHLLN
jgi:hypothetical protein